MMKFKLPPVVVKQAEIIPNSCENVNSFLAGCFLERLRAFMEQAVAHALIADDDTVGME